MTGRTLVLVAATTVVVVGAMVAFWRDLRIGFENRGRWMGYSPQRMDSADEPRRGRLVLEAVVPLLLAVVLVWWAWAAR